MPNEIVNGQLRHTILDEGFLRTEESFINGLPDNATRRGRLKVIVNVAGADISGFSVVSGKVLATGSPLGCGIAYSSSTGASVLGTQGQEQVLAAGSYRAVISKAGYTPQSLDFLVVPSQTTSLGFSLPFVGSAGDGSSIATRLAVIESGVWSNSKTLTDTTQYELAFYSTDSQGNFIPAAGVNCTTNSDFYTVTKSSTSTLTTHRFTVNFTQRNTTVLTFASTDSTVGIFTLYVNFAATTTEATTTALPSSVGSLSYSIREGYTANIYGSLFEILTFNTGGTGPAVSLTGQGNATLSIGRYHYTIVSPSGQIVRAGIINCPGVLAY